MPETTDTPLTTMAHNEGMVILPFKEEQFYDFLKSLLGKPQTIRRGYAMSYAITRDDVAHLNGLITQRIAQQNSSQLITFSAVLQFSDHSSVTFNSLEELNSYNEVKPVKSVGLELSWIYLVNFQDRASPERQEIELDFRRRSRLSQYQYQTTNLLEEEALEERRTVTLIIRHSARTWATDIENLLSDALQSLAITESGWRIVVRKWQSRIGIFGIVLSLSISLSVIFLSLYNSAERYKTEFAKLSILPSVGDNLQVLHKEISFISEFLINKETSGWWLKTIIYGVGSVFFSVLIGDILSSILPPVVGGNILYTRRALESYELKRNKHVNSWVHFLGGLVAGVTAGVIGNYVFYWLIK